MNRRIVLHVTAMLALGAVGFAALGFLVEWRQDQRVEVAAAPPAGAAPVAVLAQGVAASAAEAREELAEGDRGKAMQAVDAAMRAAVVGRHAAEGALGWAFERVARLVEEARVDVQLGAPAAARRHLAAVVATLRRAGPLAAGATMPEPGRWDEFEGAGVLDALGNRIGELEELTIEDGEALARLRLGGSVDVLGFFDVGGERATVPAGALLFGEPRLVGQLHVVVPVFSPRHDALARLGS